MLESVGTRSASASRVRPSHRAGHGGHSMRALALSSLFCCVVFGVASDARAICDVVSARDFLYRGSLGAVSRPFASPRDSVELSLDQGCATTSFLPTALTPT